MKNIFSPKDSKIHSGIHLDVGLMARLETSGLTAIMPPCVGSSKEEIGVFLARFKD